MSPFGRTYEGFVPFQALPGGVMYGHLPGEPGTPHEEAGDSPLNGRLKWFHRHEHHHPHGPLGAIVHGDPAPADATVGEAIAHYDALPVVAWVKLHHDAYGLACHGISAVSAPTPVVTALWDTAPTVVRRGGLIVALAAPATAVPCSDTGDPLGDVWRCGACTTVNAPGRSACVQCQEARP